LTTIKEVDGVAKVQEMVSLLVNVHETVAKTAWVLRSLLED